MQSRSPQEWETPPAPRMTYNIIGSVAEKKKIQFKAPGKHKKRHSNLSTSFDEPPCGNPGCLVWSELRMC